MEFSRTIFSIREARESDFESIVDYFHFADSDALLSMGADSSKLPDKQSWLELLRTQHDLSPEQKSFYYVIWLLNGQPIGHSNINKIIFGSEAYMHLHIWKPDERKKGAGVELVKMSLPYYFENFKLQQLYCEPYAFNPAPNKVLEKLGFDFIKQYDTTPGWINFPQMVNRWCMDLEKYQSLFKHNGK